MQRWPRQIYARDGVQLQRSTLADWVAQAARLLSPLAEAIGRYVVAADKVHGDDTPIRVLGGGGRQGSHRTPVGVREGRPPQRRHSAAGGVVPILGEPQGRTPRAPLKHFKGILQADAFAGYHPL
jgi:transposase